MIANNLFNFSMKNKMLVPFFTKSSNVQNCSYRRKYDLVYMMEKYATSSMDYLQWVNENVNPNKNKNAIEFIDISGLALMKHKEVFSKFQNVYVLDQYFGGMIHFKTAIKNIVSNLKVSLSTKSKLNLPNHSIDIIFSNSSFSLIPEDVRMSFLSEGLRVLKDDGVLYFSNLSAEYYDSIYELLIEYDSRLASGLDWSQFQIVNVDKVHDFFKLIFSEVKVEYFKSDWWITNVDDLIGYLLSEREFDSLKLIISESGLSKFRTFLLNKIKEDGGILIKRRVSLIIGKNKCSLKLAV